MSRVKKNDFQYFYLKLESETVLIKARCNEMYIIGIIKKLKEIKDECPFINLEDLEEILIGDNVEYVILNPIKLEW